MGRHQTFESLPKVSDKRVRAAGAAPVTETEGGGSTSQNLYNISTNKGHNYLYISITYNKKADEI